MASSEDILIHFSAEDGVSGVISSMESNVNGALESMVSAVSQLDVGLNSLSASVESISSSFSSLSISNVSTELNELESASESAGNSMEGAGASAQTAGNDIEQLGSGASSAGNDVEELGSSADSAGSGMESAGSSAETASEAVEQLGEASQNASNSIEELGAQSETAGSEIDDLAERGDRLTGSLSASSSLYIGNQLASLGNQAELMAEGMNEADMTLSQLAITTGTTEGEMMDLVTSISNVSFPNEDAMLYIKSLRQMGVDQSNYGKSATDIDSINDAFQLGARTTNSLATELSVLGVDMNNVSSSFNALAYANANTKGGMENYYAFLRKYDAQLNELGYDVDQTSVIIAGATQKYGGGRAALSGLSTALKNAGNDSSALEKELGLQAGSLSNAKQLTGEYEGQLESLAEEEEKHKTIMDQLRAVWDDVSLRYGDLIEGAAGFAGVIGNIGSFGMTINGLNELRTAFGRLLSDKGIIDATSKLKNFGKVKDAVDVGGVNIGGTKQVANSTKEVVKDASMVGGLAPEAGAAATGVTATGGAMAGISAAFTSMIVPLLAVAAVIAVMIPVVAALVAEALIFLKGIQMLLDSLNFDSIDLSGTIESIKQIGNALLQLGIAMGAMAFASIMTSLTLFVNGLTGLINPVQTAGDMLRNVAQELRKMGDIGFDTGITDKLKAISDALKLISSTMGSMTDVVLSMALGNLLTLGGALGTVTGAISKAREEIVHASNEIAKIKDLPDIDQGAIDKLKKISESLESVSKAMEALRSIRDGYNWDSLIQGIFNGVDIQTALSNVKEDIIKAGNSLQEFTGLPDIQQGTVDKLKKIADALEGVSSSLEALRSIRDNFNWDSLMQGIFNGVDIQTALNSVKNDILKAGTALNGLTGLPEIPEGIGDKLQRISDALSKVGSTMDSLRGLRDNYNWDSMMQGIFNGVDIPTALNNSRTTLQQSASALNSLNSLQEVPQEVITKVHAIGVATNRVGAVLNSMQNAQFPNIVGMAMIPINIAMAKTVLQNTATQLSQLAGLPPIPEGVTANVLKVGAGARGVASAVTSINTIPLVGPDVAFKVGLAVSAVKSTVSQLNNLQGTALGGGIGAILNSVATAVRQLRTTLMAMAPGFAGSGRSIGGSLKTGIRAGLTGLNGVVTSAVASAGNSGKAYGFTYGQGIGGRMKSGFQAQFKISSIVSQEMSNVLNAINSSSGGIVSAIGSVASQMVQEFKSKMETNSPGIIANTTRDEMGYTTDFIRVGGKNVVSAVGSVARSMVNSFNPSFNSLRSNFDVGRLESVRSISGSGYNSVNNQRPVTIVINEGAVQLDSRNLTTKESRQVMINAIEGLDVVKGIDVRGV